MQRKLENMTESQLKTLLHKVETEIRELDTQLNDKLNHEEGEKLIWESDNPPNIRLVELAKYRKKIEEELEKRNN